MTRISASRDAWNERQRKSETVWSHLLSKEVPFIDVPCCSFVRRRYFIFIYLRPISPSPDHPLTKAANDSWWFWILLYTYCIDLVFTFTPFQQPAAQRSRRQRRTMPFSHHSHSGQFCQHARNTLEEMIQAAIAKGMIVFSLTEHMPRDCLEDLYPEEVCSFFSLRILGIFSWSKNLDLERTNVAFSKPQA